jgi:hypothetical protein
MNDLNGPILSCDINLKKGDESSVNHVEDLVSDNDSSVR